MRSQPTTTHHRARNLCEAICGIDIDLAGDAEDPLSRGHACPEAVANGHPGLSLDDLTDERVADLPCGNAAVNGLAVHVERLASAARSAGRPPDG